MYSYMSTDKSDILKKGLLKFMRDIIVNNNVMHTMTSRVLNSVQQLLTISFFIFFICIFVIFFV